MWFFLTYDWNPLFLIGCGLYILKMKVKISIENFFLRNGKIFADLPELIINRLCQCFNSRWIRFTIDLEESNFELFEICDDDISRFINGFGVFFLKVLNFHINLKFSLFLLSIHAEKITNFSKVYLNTYFLK